MNFLNRVIICGPEQDSVLLKSFNEGSIVVRSSDNSQTLYLDGAGDSGWPIYLGVTKSRGTQTDKQPIEPNDIIGGLQVYARVKEGSSVGYNHEETPLTGSVIFKAGDEVDSSELLIAVKKDDVLSVKLVLDSIGNLKVAGNISTGQLVLTDESVDVTNTNAVKYVKVFYHDVAYAMPLYPIL